MGVLSVIFGIIMVMLGVSTLFTPIASGLGFGLFLGVFIGVMFIIGGFNGLISRNGEKKSVWNIIFNILIIILGILILTTDTGVWNTSKVSIIIMAVVMLIAGICRIVMAFQLKREGLAMGWTLAGGIIVTIAAITMIVFPLAGLSFFSIMLSIIVIVTGMSLITVGFSH